MTNKYTPDFRRDMMERGENLLRAFWASARKEAVPLLRCEAMRRSGMSEAQVQSALMSLLQRRLLTSDRVTDGKEKHSIYTLTPEGERLTRQMVGVAA